MDVPCPVCDAADSALYLDGDDSEISLQSVGSSRTLLSHGRILRCGSCGLAYRSFRPGVDQLAGLYRNADDSMYEAEMPNRYWTAGRHRRIVDKFVSQKGVLLDVGCASGAFLKMMYDAGWRVHGVEPSESQYNRARSLFPPDVDLQQCMLEEASFSEDFDLVTLWDVLEHVVMPTDFLKVAARRLKPGGYLLLNAPRVDSAVANLLGSRWPLLLAEHLCYFTIPSLRICGEKAGLELIHTGQRASAFSLKYTSFRAAQHRVPGAVIAHRILTRVKLLDGPLPVLLGEVYAVFHKKQAS